ncbi:hypothetical protein SADUNF_Sadunf09G0126400 [Salix dunnii]|uniref:Uncharacterized protein n=1 Tax=Salix dunnii TaxID=1413687 RepID=A0A835JYT4_9ROSI|nr:hypothetical protein SADUNF_Sadunf09G0126400 [Salix dunnii]
MASALAAGTPYWMAPESLIMKIKKRFGWFFDYHDHEKHNKDFNSEKFSKEFKVTVVSCLDQDPSMRPSADQLLEEAKALHDGTSNQITSGTDTDSAGPRMKTSRKFNVRELELDPEFCTESEDDVVVKIVCVGGETSKNPNTNVGFGESSCRGLKLTIQRIEYPMEELKMVLFSSK